MASSSGGDNGTGQKPNLGLQPDGSVIADRENDFRYDHPGTLWKNSKNMEFLKLRMSRKCLWRLHYLKLLNG